METDAIDIYTEKFVHLALGEPNGLFIRLNADVQGQSVLGKGDVWVIFTFTDPLNTFPITVLMNAASKLFRSIS